MKELLYRGITGVICILGALRWTTPWVFLGDVFWLSKSGARVKHGTYKWLGFVCNCIDCHGELIVRVDEVVALLPHYLVKDTKRKEDQG